MSAEITCKVMVNIIKAHGRDGGFKRSKIDRAKLLRIGLNERNRLTCDESLFQLFLFSFVRIVGRIWKC